LALKIRETSSEERDGVDFGGTEALSRVVIFLVGLVLALRVADLSLQVRMVTDP